MRTEASKDGPPFNNVSRVYRTETTEECFVFSYVLWYDYLPLFLMTSCPETSSVACFRVQRREMFMWLWHIAEVTEKRCSATAFNQGDPGQLFSEYCLLHLNIGSFHWSNRNVPACGTACEVTVGRRTRVIYGFKFSIVKRLVCYSVGFLAKGDDNKTIQEWKWVFPSKSVINNLRGLWTCVS